MSVAKDLFQFLGDDDDDENCSPIRNLRYNYLSRSGIEDDDEDSQRPVEENINNKGEGVPVADNQAESGDTSTSDIIKFRLMLKEMNLCLKEAKPANVSTTSLPPPPSTTTPRSSTTPQEAQKINWDDEFEDDDEDLIETLNLSDMKSSSKPAPPTFATPIAPPPKSRISLLPSEMHPFAAKLVNQPSKQSTPFKVPMLPKTPAPLPAPPVATITRPPLTTTINLAEDDDLDFLDDPMSDIDIDGLIDEVKPPQAQPQTAAEPKSSAATVPPPPAGSSSPYFFDDDLDDEDFDIDFSTIEMSRKEDQPARPTAFVPSTATAVTSKPSTSSPSTGKVNLVIRHPKSSVRVTPYHWITKLDTTVLILKRDGSN